jgi:hypothetical protein
MALTPDIVSTALGDFDDIPLELSGSFLSHVTDILNSVQKIQKTVYEESWGNTVAKVEALLAEQCTLDAAVGSLTTAPLAEGLLPVSITNNPLRYDLADFVPVPGKKLVAMDGQYRLVDQVHVDWQLIDALQQLLSPDVDAVVEFGAGWGRNLANLLLRTQNRTPDYIACEQSESGRYCFERLFERSEGASHECYPFDFYAPDFKMLDDRRHILAFTCAAIEQAALLPPAFLSDLLDAADSVTLVFYEPVGWQRFNNLARFGITKMLQEVGGLVPDEAMHQNTYHYVLRDEHFHDNAVSWSLGCRYNVNLLRIIKTYIDNFPDRLGTIRYDVFGTNPFNPYSLIVLSNRKDADR